MTFESILERCLDKVPDDLDKREGSVIYTALAPAAAEMAILYSVLSGELDRAFPDTAAGIDLTNKAKERSVFRFLATAAIRKGIFTASNGSGFDVPIGSRFSGGSLNYVVTERIGPGEYKLQAEQTGDMGNKYAGILFPIDDLNGLASATMADVLIYGEDEESDDSLRQRYFESLQAETFGGNVSDYRKKTENIQGVGSCKVFPAWAGGGTVQLVMTDSEGGVPTPTLIASVQQEMDPMGFSGNGKGWSPIGHAVTVAGVTGVQLQVAFKLTFESGYAWEGIRTNVTAAIQSYLSELIQKWADADTITVRLSQIEAKVLAVHGVVDIGGTTVNGLAQNVTLTAMEIPLLGTVTHNA